MQLKKNVHIFFFLRYGFVAGHINTMVFAIRY